jgi:DNA-binding Lrp family transcriptional regulator
MVTSIILINVERTRINEVAAQLVECDEISEVYSVSGKYDLIAIVRVRTTEDLSTLVTDKLRKVENIIATETMLAFQAYSKHDLESMFSLGLDG